jgi:hypothetical protein
MARRLLLVTWARHGRGCGVLPQPCLPSGRGLPPPALQRLQRRLLSPLGSAHPRSFLRRDRRPAAFCDAAGRAFRRDFAGPEADNRRTPIF